MTPLTKKVTRRCNAAIRGRSLVVTLYPGDVIGVRELRTKAEYTLPISWIYEMAVKHEVRRKLAEKKALRKGKAR